MSAIFTPGTLAALAAETFSASRPLHYGAYHIWLDPPPIPTRAFDWTFAHEDYDGAPDSGDTRCGFASSIADAVRQIDEIERERREASDDA